MAVASTGRYRRAVSFAPDEEPRDLALDATLKVAALRHARAGQRPAFPGLITRADLRKKQRYRPCENLIVLLVDASDSMGDGTAARMKAAKGAVLAILRNAYQNRSQVALITFSGEHARIALPPTASISRARACLARLPTGGATPFAEGLRLAWQLIRRERQRWAGVRPVLVIISDGEANVPLREGAPPLTELVALADLVRQDHLVSVLIDVVDEPGAAIQMPALSARLGATYVKVRDLKTRHILEAVEPLVGGAVLSAPR